MADEFVQEGTQDVTTASSTADQTSDRESAQAATQDASATSTEAQTQTTAKTTEEEGAEPSAAAKRIAQLIARNKELERRLAATAADQQRTTQVLPTDKPPEKPDPNKFEKWEDYEAAKDEWLISMGEYRATQKVRARTIETAQAEMERTYRTRMEKAAETDPEIFEIESDPTLPVSTPMAFAIKGSDHAPSVLRYLHEHRDEASRIARMVPIAAIMAIGRIEAKLSLPKAEPIKTVSQAPEPAKTVGGTKGTVETEPGDTESWIEKRNREVAEKRKSGRW
jgi:hypothetical protein